MARNLNTYRASRRIGWAGSVRKDGKLPDWKDFCLPSIKPKDKKKADNRQESHKRVFAALAKAGGYNP